MLTGITVFRPGAERRGGAECQVGNNAMLLK
jgi:hypothetical protein